MVQYRRYLYTAEKISRSTLCRRRQRRKLREIASDTSVRKDTTTQPLLATQLSREQAATIVSESSNDILTADIEQDRNNQFGSENIQTINDAAVGDEDQLPDLSFPRNTDAGCQETTPHNHINSEPSSIVGASEQSSSVNFVEQDVDDNFGCDNVDEGDDIKELKEKLCRCCDTTVGELLFMCLVLGMRHNLSWSAQVDILRMVRLIHGVRDIPQNKATYFKKIGKGDHTIAYHIYCTQCELYLGERDDANSEKLCENCQKNVDSLNPSNFFLSISLESQIKELLQDERTASLLLEHRFTRKKYNDSAYEDIYDGEEYKKHSKPGGILASPYNFSFSFSTDGVPTGKSTGKTMWPIYVTLNELPYKERSKYILIAGLYIGPKDPNQLIFLKPFVDQANKLATEGFVWEYRGKSVKSKIITLCAITDSVARWQVLNMQTFTAFYGCTFCYQKQVATAPRKRRYDILSPRAEDRTAQSTHQDAIEAFNRRELAPDKRAYRGVKGPSALINLKYFNLIWGFVVEYMHAILLGCVRTHMNLLFESTRKKFWIDMNDSVALDHLLSSIDKRLLSIKPPTSITRAPRTIKDLKIWKASEWRSWLLFYFVPCLTGLLKEKHLSHLAMLSRATHLLLQKSITKEEVEEANDLFLKYCYYFQKYFNIQHTIFNIHLITHATRCVVNWGPLWGQNAFCFEAENRHLLQFYKSPFNVALQIAVRYNIYSSIPTLCTKFVSSEKVLNFSEELLRKRLVHFFRCDNSVLAGKMLKMSLSEEEERLLLLFTGWPSESCVFYQRIIYGGMRITTADYAEGKLNNDSYIFDRQGRIIVIYAIVLLPTRSISLLGKTVTVFDACIVDDARVRFKEVKKVRYFPEFVCLSPSDIQCQCISRELTPEHIFVCRMPYGCYGD